MTNRLHPSDSGENQPSRIPAPPSPDFAELLGKTGRLLLPGGEVVSGTFLSALDDENCVIVHFAVPTKPDEQASLAGTNRRMRERLTINRMVHYVSHGTPIRPDGSQKFASTCRSAIITEVGELPEGAPWMEPVALAVLNPTGLFFHQRVLHDEERSGGTWHWPTPHC